MKAAFGPAGTAESFSALGYRKTIEVPRYLKRFGLGLYEYQCGHGVRISDGAAAAFGAEAAKEGILLSVHAPYYISLSSVEAEKREKSVGYILQTARAAHAMGAERIVVHSGSCARMSREEAWKLAADTLRAAQRELDAAGLSEVRICPETMGKFNQLGDLDEVLAFCRLEERFLPCIDFGHLNARTLGGMNSREAFAALLDRMEDRIGAERARVFHAHFSKIEYTGQGGEKRHLTFSDSEYGPEFAPLGGLLAERGLAPRIICESAGTQTEDAAAMQRCYRSFLAGPEQESGDGNGNQDHEPR